MSSIERAKKAAGKALLLEKVPIHEQLGPNATRYEQETQEFADLAIRAALDSGELHAVDECPNRKEQGITMFCESKFTIPPLNDNEQPQRNHPPLIYQCTLPKGHTLAVDSTKNVHEHVDEKGVLRAAWPNSESFLGVKPIMNKTRSRRYVVSASHHLMIDFYLRPRQIAKHLQKDHGIEPKLPRKGYEREVWHAQHEYETAHGIPGEEHESFIWTEET